MIIRSIQKIPKQVAKLGIKLGVMGSLLLSPLIISSSSHAQSVYKPKQDYFCAKLNGEWKTWVKHPLAYEKRVALIHWDTDINQEWTKKKRCISGSNRLQALHDNGLLKEFVGGKVNGMPVLCGVKNKGEGCITRNGITVNQMFQLKVGQDPDVAVETLTKLATLKANGNTEILRLSGNKCFKDLADYNEYLIRLKDVVQNSKPQNIKTCIGKKVYYNVENSVNAIYDYEKQEGNLVDESKLIPVTE